MLLALLWLAVAHETPAAHIQPQAILNYYIFAAILYGLSNFHTDNIEEDIRLGNISKFLVKPISPFWYYAINMATEAFAEFVTKIVVMIPIAMALGLQLQIDLSHTLLFLIYVPIIFFGMFTLYFTLSTLAFWIQAVDSLRMSVMFVFRFLSGVFVSVSFMPQWYQNISMYLPFQQVAFSPIQIITNQMSLENGVVNLGILILWMSVFGAGCHLLWQRATHSYEANGI